MLKLGVKYIKRSIIKSFGKRKIYYHDMQPVVQTLNAPLNSDTMQYQIAVYFSAATNNIYQIEQWLKIFSALDENIVFIVRKKSTFNWLKNNTNFTTIYCHGINDLAKTYEENDFKCILYVNHGLQNFQSLMCRSALHIHINHGESEKTSTISNQINAYNYVFIVGDAAYDKYKYNLLEKDMKKFIKVGRPQLEHIEKISLKKRDKKVILYAPTWEGTHESMNFTSLNDYGLALVKEILIQPDLYLIYKPHPSIGARDINTKGINTKIMKLLNRSPYGETMNVSDINTLYEHVDIAIFDNSAVAIDYLQVDKPMIMTDMFHRIKKRNSEIHITRATKVLSVLDIDDIGSIVREEIEEDSFKEKRNEMKRYFLGDFDYRKKESTKIFMINVNTIMKKRDSLLMDMPR